LLFNWLVIFEVFLSVIFEFEKNNKSYYQLFFS
jgi:hypothetical protein